MAFLGHSARLRVHHEAPSQAALAWVALGFEQETATETEVHLTDGQIFVCIVQGAPSPGQLEYVAASLQSVKDKLLAAGQVLDVVSQTEIRFAGPGKLDYLITPATAHNVVHRTGDSNAVLGYLDSLVVSVEDADASAVWAQKCGYFIAEATGRDIPCVDVTDGIWMLSFREQGIVAPFLHYTADIDDEWTDEIASVFPSAQIHRDSQGDAVLIVCNMPGEVRIMITNDEIE
jgi:hypothetical protein